MALIQPTEEKRLISLVIETALEAGRAILQVYATHDPGTILKEDRSPLTRADLDANRIILERLASTGIPCLTEEAANDPWEMRRNWSRCWIIDPLDGTKEFISRNGEFTVNIALAENGIPVSGVVYAPVTGELYFGSAQGSFKTIIPTPDHSDAESVASAAHRLPMPQPGKAGYTVVASRSHLNPETEAFIRSLQPVHGAPILVSRGSSLKLCMVAEGAADIYPRLGPTMEWDMAAGHAVARYAGCTVTDADTGDEVRYNKPDLHNPFFIVERRSNQL